MMIQLPRMNAFPLNSVPEDFDEQVIDAFAGYTEGTNASYRYQDRLCFIDHCVDALHGKKRDSEAVEEMILDYVRYSLREEGTIPENDDVNTKEFKDDCYAAGKESQRLYWKKAGERENEAIMKLLIRIMKIVLDWEPEEGEDE